MIRSALAATALVLVGLAGAPATAAAEPRSAEEIVACMKQNAPRADNVRSLRVVTVGRAGQERVTRIDAYGRLAPQEGRRLLLRFTEPKELEGSSFLIVEQKGANEFYLYTPAIGGQRKVEASEMGGSLFGTDFSYEDIARYQGLLTESKVERKGDASVAGRPAFVLEARPPAGTSTYTRVVSAVDRERCVLLEAKMYETDAAEPRKVLSTDPEAILYADGHWIPQRATLRDLRDGSRTELEVRTVLSVAVPDQLFDPKRLGAVQPRVEISPDKPVPQIEIDLGKPTLSGP